MFLREGAAANRDAWRQFEWRVAQKRIVVTPVHGGNIRMTAQNRHQSEFATNLMHWSLEQTKTPLATG